MGHVIFAACGGFLLGVLALGAFIEFQNRDIGGYWLFLHKDSEHK
jgi:hypothetical protein